MHKLVSPEGVLHLLPLDDRSILSFTKAHGLKDKKYLMKHLHGEQDESYGWQLLAQVKWLQHSSGVVIPVVGKATHTFDARAAVCQRAGIDSTFMPWDTPSLHRPPLYSNVKTLLDNLHIKYTPPLILDHLHSVTRLPDQSPDRRAGQAALGARGLHGTY